MKKYFKKTFLILSTVMLSLTLAACSSLPTNMTAEQVLEKIADSEKNIKSTDFKSNLTIETLTKTNSSKLEVAINGFTIKDPLSEKVTINTTNTSNTDGVTEGYTEFYIKNNELLLRTDNASGWNKYNNEVALEPYKNINNLNTSEKILNFYKSIAKDFKADKDGDNLILSYTGSGDSFKDLLLEIMNSSTTGEKTNPENINVNFKNVTIKYTVKAKDFTPVASDITMDLEAKDDSSQTMKLSQKLEYSNINNISEITIPDEVKNNIIQIIGN